MSIHMLHSAQIIVLEDVNLFGELKVPADAPGVALFAHGSGSGRLSPRNQYVARVLREKGIGTLLFDLLSMEEEHRDEIDGSLRFDIEFLAKRLIGVAQWAQEQPEVQGLKLGFHGSSTGGAAALVAAAEMGEEISAVVSRGGRPDLAREALHRVKSPTRLIVGGLDEVVIRLNKEALEEMRCPKELVIVPGAGHLFEEPGKLDVVARLGAEWFAKYLR